MQVILAKKIEGLGAEADLVTVKAGYGRNFLIPQGLAFEATKSNTRFTNNLKAARAKREAEEKASAEEVSKKIAATTLKMALESGQDGKTFGAVTTQTIHEALSAKDIEIDRRSIQLEKPIKTSGEHQVEIKLHHDVTATVKIVVKVTGEKEETAEA